ncbi:MAG: GMC family oxidoreductase [Blastocatellia bacterium]
MKTEYDVVVIGAGVAGALIAWKLADKGASVALLDAGEKRMEDADRKAFVKAFAEAAQKNKTPSQPFVTERSQRFAFSPDPPDFKITKPGDGAYYRQSGPDVFKSQYQRIVGGSTLSWRGNCPRNIPNDFKLKTLYNVAVDWPISYDDLEPWYCDAEDALGVAGDHDEWNNLLGAYRSRQFPMPKIAQCHGDQQLIKRLKGFKVDDVAIKLLGLPQARNSEKYDGRPACEGNSNCIPVCPIQAKYDATIHVKKAEKLGAELIRETIVTELKVDPSKNISEVVYRTWDGRVGSVKGKIVVLAAHAIESAKILQMSNGGKGIANSSDQVGRNLMDHPGGEGAAIMPFQVFPFRGPQSTSCIEGFRDHPHRHEFCAFRMTIGNDGWGRGKHPFETLRDLTARKLYGKELKETLNHIVTRQLRIAYTTEQLPDPNNRVTLSAEVDGLGIPKPAIAFKMDDYVFDGMRVAQSVIKRIFTKLGAREEEWEFSDLKSRFYSGSAHIMGTCRMGGDPKKSVVDDEGRSHDHKNLFLAGSSVFPTSAPTNPTVTLAALALRTADAVLKKLKS